MMSNFSSDVFARAMRLVIPMRREYGKSIDVQNFLYDMSYAREVLHLAINSKNEKLKENAEHLERIVFGPRETGLISPESGSFVKVQIEQVPMVDGATIAGNQGAIEEPKSAVR